MVQRGDGTAVEPGTWYHPDRSWLLHMVHRSPSGNAELGGRPGTHGSGHNPRRLGSGCSHWRVHARRTKSLWHERDHRRTCSVEWRARHGAWSAHESTNEDNPGPG